MQRELSGGGSSRYAAEGRQEGRQKGGRMAAGRNAEAVSAAPRLEGAGNRSIMGNNRRRVLLQASESAAGALRSAQADRLSGAAGRRLVVSKALAQQKGLAIKKSCFAFYKA